MQMVFVEGDLIRKLLDVETDAYRKKTACGCCGQIQMGWYDRKVRWVRDLLALRAREPGSSKLIKQRCWAALRIGIEWEPS
jgi:hypothetical protein